MLSEMAIPEKLKQLAEELTNWKEYQITYGRPERLVPPEMVEVSVKQPGLRVRESPAMPRNDYLVSSPCTMPARSRNVSPPCWPSFT